VKPIRDFKLAAAIKIAVTRFEEWRELERETESLQEALGARRVVEQAKHVLMSRYGLTERKALMRIHRQGRDSRRPMREVAESWWEG
jgi:response regulator NasT